MIHPFKNYPNNGICEQCLPPWHFVVKWQNLCVISYGSNLKAMKKFCCIIGLLCLCSQAVEAQAKKKKTPSDTVQQKTPVKTNTKQTTQLKNSASYPAKTPALPTSTLGWRNMELNNTMGISDPVVRTLNDRANGSLESIDFREFMGYGRGAYGLKHGHIMLRPTGSTTSGGITGSGTVGTGSSLGSIGIHGMAVGVNGKNPFAGPGMWGTTGTGIGTNFRMHDSSNRSIRVLRDK
jgi:hypothetical protein